MQILPQPQPPAVSDEMIEIRRRIYELAGFKSRRRLTKAETTEFKELVARRDNRRTKC
jgi:hypothetical protein